MVRARCSLGSARGSPTGGPGGVVVPLLRVEWFSWASVTSWGASDVAACEGEVCERGCLGAQRRGTHLLRVCTSFPESPPLGGQGGTSRLPLDLGGSQGARPLPGVCLPPSSQSQGLTGACPFLGVCVSPVLLEGDSEAGQAPPGSAALVQPAPCCAQMRLGTSGQFSSLF